VAHLLRTPLRVAVGVVVALGILVTTTSAMASASSRSQARLVGELGYEGGVAPGGFHPTAGTVEVRFTLNPLILDWKVGPSGRFRIPLGPGTYTIVGCGPSSSAVSTPVCGTKQTVTLTAHRVDHVQLVWAYVP
jgi:hypothetical protein